MRSIESRVRLTPSPLYSGEKAGERGRAEGKRRGWPSAQPLSLTLSPEYRGEGTSDYIPDPRPPPPPPPPPPLLPLGRPHWGGPKGLVLPAAARDSAVSSPVTTSTASVRPSPWTSVVIPSVAPARTVTGRRNSPERTHTVPLRYSGSREGRVVASALAPAGRDVGPPPLAPRSPRLPRRRCEPSPLLPLPPPSPAVLWPCSFAADAHASRAAGS